MKNTFFRILRHVFAFLFLFLFSIFVVRYLLSVHEYEQAQHDKYIHAIVVPDNGAQVVSSEKGE